MTTTPAVRSRARIAVIVVTAIAVSLAAGFAVRLALAKGDFDVAQAVRLEQAVRLDAAQEQLDAAVIRAETELAVAQAALDAVPVGYVAEDAAAALADSRVGLEAAVEAVRGSALELADAPAASIDPAALWTAADEALEQAEDAHAATTAQADAIEQLQVAEAATADAGASLIASAKAVATTILPAHPSVANQPHVSFLKVQESLAGLDALDAGSVEVLTMYVAAADSVTLSHAAEEAEKAGPLYGLRAEVEAFARSISGGVLLDFNWQPIVIGYSMAGTATIESAPPYYYSTITLTNSIAENWGDTVPVALVTHEVGHAITSKCMDLFEASFEGDYERWATAWAISWGNPAGPSGGNEYGVPSDEQVAIAGTCR
jgi:hypothetical protein